MERKIKRFIELSKEFTVTSEEVYEGFESIPSYFNISYSGSQTINIGGDFSNATGYSNTNQLSKLEQYENLQLKKVNKVKRYEEYLELQTLLSEYYDSLNKLNK